MNERALQKNDTLFRDIVRFVRTETCWELDQELSTVEGQIDAVAGDERARGELYFIRPETAARISLQFPVYETQDAAKLLLDNPLDTQLTHSEEGFVGQLCETHREIAQNHETEYLNPVGDPSLLCRTLVPVEYMEGTLSDTLTAMDTIAVETERLHDKLFDLLREYE